MHKIESNIFSYIQLVGLFLFHIFFDPMNSIKMEIKSIFELNC